MALLRPHLHQALEEPFDIEHLTPHLEVLLHLNPNFRLQFYINH